MARQVADRKLTLTSSVRGSLVAKVVQLAQKKGVSVSEVVDGILSEYFERAARRVRTGRVATVTAQDQDQQGA
jgi:hypothetical protein